MAANGVATTAQSILVTGSSSGFGALAVRTLARQGHHVFATMRGTTARNAAAAEELRAWAGQEGVRLEVVELDVTDDASVRSAVAAALASAGHLDVVVNNAGASAAGPIEAFSMQQVAALFDLNAFGPLRVCQAVLPGMRAQRAGLLIFVTSTLGRVLPGRGGLYPSTKWALEGLAESLCYQVAPFGIEVAIIEPGSFPTPAISKSGQAEHQDVAAAYAAVAPPSVPRALSPDQTPPDPQEIADAIARLVALPAGQRPLRTVVGPVFTEGVAEYNEIYERTRQRLADSLERPDQAITWSARPSAR